MLRYVRHEVDAYNHWKFKLLRASKYGWAGEAKFWALNCIIAKDDIERLDLSRKNKSAAIAAELDFSLQEFQEFIDYLIDEAELLRKDEHGLFTDIVDETSERVNKRRKRQKEYYERKKETEQPEQPEQSAPPKIEKGIPKTVIEFYQEQFKIAKADEDTKARESYYTFVRHLFNEGVKNIINAPGLHILRIKNQVTFEEFCKLRDYCKPRDITPISLLNSWLNNVSYSKGKVSVYATLRNWASKEPTKGSNLR